MILYLYRIICTCTYIIMKEEIIMKRKIFSLVVAVLVLVMSLSVLSVFAETEELDITPATLRTLNGADDKDGADAQKGATYQGVGDWYWTGGAPGQGTNEYLMPFDEEWTYSGTPAHVLFMNYDNYILIAKDIDLSKYSKVLITYSTDATFAASENEIGLFSKAASFGFGTDRKTDGLIASGTTTPADGASWDVTREMEFDLNSDYKGDLYLAHYMKEASGVCVTNIEFTLKDGASSGQTTNKPSNTETPTTTNKPTGSGTPNTSTGDLDYAIVVAAAAIVLTVILKKGVVKI